MNYLIILCSLFWTPVAHSFRANLWTTNQPFKLFNYGENKCVYFLQVASGSHALLGDCATANTLIAVPTGGGNFRLQLLDPNSSSVYCLGNPLDMSFAPKVALTNCNIDVTNIWTSKNLILGTGISHPVGLFTEIMTANGDHVDISSYVEPTNPNALWNQQIGTE